ncbi:hypothetical protein BJ546DRAFT_369343 [Cryomyces antarcticus]
MHHCPAGEYEAESTMQLPKVRSISRPAHQNSDCPSIPLHYSVCVSHQRLVVVKSSTTRFHAAPISHMESNRAPPLPLTSWASVPMHYRPLGWSSQESEHPATGSWRFRDEAFMRGFGRRQGGGPPAQKKRPARLRSFARLRPGEHVPDEPLPPSQTYLDPARAGLSPTPWPRSVSQPNTPSWMVTGSQQATEQVPLQRRSRSFRNESTDETFDNQAQVRLFVEATSGLFGHCPSGEVHHGAPSATLRRSPLPQAHSNHGFFHMFPEALDDHDQGGDVQDDELPNYAQSQEEAHAVTRRQATQRAAELERRWEQGLRNRD